MKKIIMSSVVTIIVMLVVLVSLMFRFGLIRTEADVETHQYEIYCDGIRVDSYNTETFNGVNVNMNVNGEYHIGR